MFGPNLRGVTALHGHAAPYEFFQTLQSESPFYNKWNKSNMKIQITLFALSNLHVLQQYMYTQSLFTSTHTCIRTLFTSTHTCIRTLFTWTCIHFPHQHLLYFSHQHVHTHMFIYTYLYMAEILLIWHLASDNQSIFEFTLFISECIHFYIMVVYGSILVWCTVASPMDISVWVKNSWVGRKPPNKQMNEASDNSVLCDISVLLVSLFSVDISLPRLAACNYCCNLF